MRLSTPARPSMPARRRRARRSGSRPRTRWSRSPRTSAPRRGSRRRDREARVPRTRGARSTSAWFTTRIDASRRDDRERARRSTHRRRRSRPCPGTRRSCSSPRPSVGFVMSSSSSERSPVSEVFGERAQAFEVLGESQPDRLFEQRVGRGRGAQLGAAQVVRPALQQREREREVDVLLAARGDPSPRAGSASAIVEVATTTFSPDATAGAR